MSAYRTKAERCTSARQVEPTAEVTPAVACSSAVDLDGAGSSQSLHVSRLVSRTSRGYRGRRYRETMPAAGTADIAVTPWPQSANRSCSVLAILPRPDVQSLPTVAPISASQRLSRRCAQTQTVCLLGRWRSRWLWQPAALLVNAAPAPPAGDQRGQNACKARAARPHVWPMLDRPGVVRLSY